MLSKWRIAQKQKILKYVHTYRVKPLKINCYGLTIWLLEIYLRLSKIISKSTEPLIANFKLQLSQVKVTDLWKDIVIFIICEFSQFKFMARNIKVFHENSSRVPLIIIWLREGRADFRSVRGERFSCKFTTTFITLNRLTSTDVPYFISFPSLSFHCVYFLILP